MLALKESIVGLLFQDIELSVTSSCFYVLPNSSISLNIGEIPIDIPN